MGVLLLINKCESKKILRNCCWKCWKKCVDGKINAVLENDWKTSVISNGKCIVDHYMHWQPYSLVLVFTKLNVSKSNWRRKVFSVLKIIICSRFTYLFRGGLLLSYKKKKKKEKWQKLLFSPFFPFKNFLKSNTVILSEILMQKIAAALKPSCLAFCGTLPVASVILTHKVTPSLSLLIPPEAVLHTLQLLSHVKGNSLSLTSWTALSELSIA